MVARPRLNPGDLANMGLVLLCNLARAPQPPKASMRVYPDLMDELLPIARQAAEAASAELLARFEGNPVDLETKSSPEDFVSAADRAAEKAISEVILGAFPQDGILSEEAGVISEGFRTWVVDPLDGTANYLRSLSSWAISIAVRSGERVVCGLVHSPLDGVEWAAENGSFLRNGSPIRRKASIASGLDSALAGVRVKLNPKSARYHKVAEALELIGSPRYFGSAALHLAWLAEGKLDFVYYEYPKIGEWDVAAGIGLCQAAGLSAFWLEPATPAAPRRFIAGPASLVTEWLALTE